MQSVLEIKNFTKEYSQGKKAVDNLSYPLCPEKFMALSGITEPEKLQPSGLLSVSWALTRARFRLPDTL